MSIGGGGPSKPEPPEPTAEERALAERSVNEWNDFVTRFMPAQDHFVNLIRPSGDDRERLGAEASATAAEATAGAGLDAASVGRRMQSGAAPSSGRHVLSVGDQSGLFSSAVGGGVAAGERALENREVKGLLKASANMRGLADQSTLGLTQAGQRATERELFKSRERIAKNDAEISEQQAITGGIMGGLGLYAGYKDVFGKSKEPGNTKHPSKSVASRGVIIGGG